MDATPEMTRRKLLLADDSVTIRKVVELTFAEEGIEVISAANGDEAMQRFVERTPDIVLVDVEMPGMSGYKICEMIKGDESTKDIPVLLLVGSFEPFDQDEAERVLADGFLTKPFHSIRELVGRVNELIGDAPGLPTADTADIEDLYNSSFAETVPLHEEITEEDLSEISYVEEPEAEEPLMEAAVEEPSSGSEGNDPVLDEEIVEENPAHAEEAEPAVGETPVEEEDLGEPSFDDEMLETVHASHVSENGHDHEDSPSAETIETHVNDFAWETRIEDDPETEPEAATVGAGEGHHLSLVQDASVDPAIHDSKADTEEYSSPYATAFPEVASPVAPAPVPSPPAKVELSEETIDLIAKRVAEKLSDRAVREIAQEAVPRIAEKLIREALDEEGKT